MAADPRLIPHYAYVTNKPPTEADKALDRTLKAYMEDPRSSMQIESDAEMQKRDRVLLRLQQIFKAFVKNVAMNVRKMSEEDAEDAGGDLLVSGSHRLGVRDIGADIDTICVAPNFVNRTHFFSILKEELLSLREVTDFSSIETAVVPIMSFDLEGVSIDLLFAQLAGNVVPKNLNEYVLNDRILMGIDEATEKSLNGPRVTNMIPLLANKAKDADGHLVDHDAYPTRGSTEQLRDNKFLVVLRCVRRWAKVKGLYGNKMGYLGGINCNLLVAMVCQRYPNASPSNLLARFFLVYSKWPWPTPVQLNSIQPHPSFFGETDKGEVWSPETGYRDQMPIITPAYPAMNSSASVNRHTLGVMKRELTAAYEVCKTVTASIKEQGYMGWARLFEQSDFFVAYNHYLLLHIVGNDNSTESRGWTGFVESRIRTFLNVLEPLALSTLHLYPKGSKTQKSANSLCYFVGFEIDHARLRSDKTIDFGAAVARFKSNGVNGLFDKFKGQGQGGQGQRPEGLDFVVEHVAWLRLPREVWDCYGGKEGAKARRVALGICKSKEENDKEKEKDKDGAGAGAGAGEGGGATVKAEPGTAESKEGEALATASAESKTADGSAPAPALSAAAALAAATLAAATAAATAAAAAAAASSSSAAVGAGRKRKVAELEALYPERIMGASTSTNSNNSSSSGSSDSGSGSGSGGPVPAPVRLGSRGPADSSLSLLPADVWASAGSGSGSGSGSGTGASGLGAGLRGAMRPSEVTWV